MTQADRNAYWQRLAASHIYIMDGAAMEGGGTRKSFIVDVEDEIDASEFLKLDLPCVANAIVDGRIVLKEGAYKNRYQNKVLFLTRFGIVSDDNPSIPESKEAAIALTYEIMQDFLNKLQSDYEDDQCADFKFIDENSYRWECIEMMADNLCGWALYFNDEENKHFVIDETKWMDLKVKKQWQQLQKGRTDIATAKTMCVMC
jgi:hypothetical protein